MVMVWTYATYLVLSLALTALVAQTLHKNGRIFLVDAFKGFLEAGVGASRLFAPGTGERFDMAKMDALAAIGRTMTPVVEALTEFTRLIGDLLATVLPGLDEMRDMLAPLRDMFVDLRQALGELAPLLKTILGVYLRGVINNFVMLGRAILFVTTPLRALIHALGWGASLQSSYGMAARNIQFSQSPDVAQQTYQAAFRAGVEPQQATKNYLANLDTNVEGILAWLHEKREQVQEIGEHARYGPIGLGVWAAKKLWGRAAGH